MEIGVDMANYVHNYLFCSSVAKEKLLSLDYEYVYEISRGYGETIHELGDDRFLVMFNTRGMEYRTEFIEKFITEFNDTRWYCIEENEMEQGCYLWDGKGISFAKRNLVQSLPGREVRIKYSDSEYRPYLMILLSDKQMFIENYLENRMTSYIFGGDSSKAIAKYMDSLIFTVIGDFVEYSIPLKDGIDRTINIHWNDKSLDIESSDDDDWLIRTDNGEELFDNIIAFFENVLKDEGIDSKISVDTSILEMF